MIFGNVEFFRLARRDLFFEGVAGLLRPALQIKIVGNAVQTKSISVSLRKR